MQGTHVPCNEYTAWRRGSPEHQSAGGPGRGAEVPLMHMNKQVRKRNLFHRNSPKNCLCLEQRCSGGRENISSPYYSSIKHQERLKKKNSVLAISNCLTSHSNCTQLAVSGHAVLLETIRCLGGMPMFRTFPQTHTLHCFTWELFSSFWSRTIPDVLSLSCFTATLSPANCQYHAQPSWRHHDHLARAPGAAELHLSAHAWTHHGEERAEGIH